MIENHDLFNEILNLNQNTNIQRTGETNHQTFDEHASSNKKVSALKISFYSTTQKITDDYLNSSFLFSSLFYVKIAFSYFPTIIF